MLYWAVVFLVIAIIAGLFGFGGIASASAEIAQILFFIFLVLLVISLIMYFVVAGDPHRRSSRDAAPSGPRLRPGPKPATRPLCAVGD